MLERIILTLATLGIRRLKVEREILERVPSILNTLSHSLGIGGDVTGEVLGDAT